MALHVPTASTTQGCLRSEQEKQAVGGAATAALPTDGLSQPCVASPAKLGSLNPRGRLQPISSVLQAIVHNF